MFDPIRHLDPETLIEVFFELFRIPHSDGAIKEKSKAIAKCRCPYCNAIWLFKEDDICHKCFRSVEQKGLKKVPETSHQILS